MKYAGILVVEYWVKITEVHPCDKCSCPKSYKDWMKRKISICKWGLYIQVIKLYDNSILGFHYTTFILDSWSSAGGWPISRYVIRWQLPIESSCLQNTHIVADWYSEIIICWFQKLVLCSIWDLKMIVHHTVNMHCIVKC